jgi:hypothetical protein
MTDVKVIIPFRDRGIDPRRAANLEIVQAWWYAHGFDPQIVDDGLEGDAQFNRHRAYNRAVSRNADADVFVFAEADMLVHPDQIRLGVRLAVRQPGLVVPFTRYHYLSDASTGVLRDGYHDDVISKDYWWGEPAHSPTSVFAWEPESTMDNGTSVGAVNIVSRETLEITGGFTEATSGNWYDDRIIDAAFSFLTGNKTAFVPGPAVHLYHLPGHRGAHLTGRDRMATQRNRDLLRLMKRDIRLGNREPVKNLMGVRR